MRLGNFRLGWSKKEYTSGMNFFGTMYQTVLDALFPLTNEEREILTTSPEMAYEKLPKAPAYSEPLPGMTSIFAYKDERVAKLVWNIKYKKSETAVKIGGYALWQRLQSLQESERGQIVIIPLPITDRRRKERGYNQTELLVDEISRLDAGAEKRLTISKDVLLRTRHAARQTLKGRKERLESSKGIFVVNEDVIERFGKNTRIIIIDDVITTGSTMKEALAAMRAAGFENVTGLSLAH
jgi:ComF family protein